MNIRLQQGAPLWQGEANRAEQKADKSWQMEGSVIWQKDANSSQPLTLKSSEIIYHPDRGVLQSPGPVKLFRPGSQLEAGSLSARLPQGELILKQRVSSRHDP